MEDRIIQLVEQAQCGNEEAFTELFHMYYPSAYKKACSICLNEADAKDAVQESFYEVHRSLHKLREPSKFYSWLMMIVMSKSNLQYRRYRHLASNAIDEYTNVYEEKRKYMDPIKHIEDESERDILLSLIDSMTPKQSEIVRLMYLREMKLSEIARELGIPLGTVKTRAARAKEELRKRIDEYEKTENRRLNFHVDMLLPSALIGASYLTTLSRVIKQKASQVMNFASQNATMSICTASLSGLLVTGGVFAYQDYQNLNGRPEQSTAQTTPQIKEEEMVPEIPLSAFSPVSYAGDDITTIRDAYFSCMNFAQDEETMKQRTKEEFQEIIPLYEQLKNSDSPYYKQLLEDGWISLFEVYANR